MTKVTFSSLEMAVRSAFLACTRKFRSELRGKAIGDVGEKFQKQIKVRF